MSHAYVAYVQGDCLLHLLSGKRPDAAPSSGRPLLISSSVSDHFALQRRPEPDLTSFLPSFPGPCCKATLGSWWRSLIQDARNSATRNPRSLNPRNRAPLPPLKAPSPDFLQYPSADRLSTSPPSHKDIFIKTSHTPPFRSHP